MAGITDLLGLIVSAAGKGAGKTIGQSVGSAVGQGVGQALGQGIGGAIGGSSAPTGQGYTAPDPAQPYTQDPGQPYDPGDGGTVDEIVVPGSSTPQTSLANLMPAAPLNFQSYGDLAPSAPMPQLANVGTPNYANTPSVLDGLTVQGANPLKMIGSDVTPSAPFSLTNLLDAPAPTLGQPTVRGGGVDEKGLLAMLGITGGAASLLKGGLGLLPLIPLIKTVIDGPGGGGGGGGGGGTDPTKTIDSLTETVNNNRGLTSTLTNKAMANLGGNIGAGGMSAIQRSVRAAQARIRARYHNMNMSGSTAEAQDLQGAEQAGVETQFKIAQDMATQGLTAVASLTGQSMDAYARILAAQMAQGTALGNASAAYAGAMSTALGNFGRTLDGML